MKIRCSGCSKVYSDKKKVCPRCGKDNSLAPDYVDGGIEIDVSGLKSDIKKKIESIETEFDSLSDNYSNNDSKKSAAKETNEPSESASISDDESAEKLRKNIETISEIISKKIKKVTKKMFHEGYCEFCGEEMISSVYCCPRCKRSNNGVKNLEKKYDANHFTSIHREFLSKNNGVIDRNKYLKMVDLHGFNFEKWNSNYTYKTGIRSNVLANELIWTFGFIFLMAITINQDGSAFSNPFTWIFLLIGNIAVPFVSRHIYDRYITFTMKNIDYAKPSRNEGENYSTSVDELENIELVLYEGFYADNIIFTSKREIDKAYIVFNIPTAMYHKNDELAIFVLMFCMKHNLKLIISRSGKKRPVLDNIASAYVSDNGDQDNILSDDYLKINSEGNISDNISSISSYNNDDNRLTAKGYVHVYTGNGKGKTTAAFGVALRAACSGKKVYIGQFVKDMKYSETKVVEKYDNILIEQLGAGCFIENDPTENDIRIAEKALDKCGMILEKGDFDLVILDEVTIALLYKLLKEEDVIKAIKNRAKHVEVIITGRYATEGLIDMADLVTEMKEIKHYYSQGVLSREGIDC